MDKIYMEIDEIYRDIGSEIRFRRKGMGLSEKELGNILNVSQQQVSRYENAESKISLDKLILISTILDINLERLLKIKSSDYIPHVI